MSNTVNPIPVSSVRIETSRYEGTHRRKPAGRGLWAFILGEKTVYTNRMMLFSDARNYIKRIAAEQGVRYVQVAP